MRYGVRDIINIGSGNGFLPVWHQAIIWINADLLSVWTSGINSSDILMEIRTFFFKKIHLKMSSANDHYFIQALVWLTH